MSDDVAKEIALLRARVCALEDREEIRQLTAEYMQAMHDARWEDALACFADDACYDHGVLGFLPDKQALREFYTRFMPAFEGAGGWAFDLLADPVIHTDGDAATGRWLLLTLATDPESGEASWSMSTLDYGYKRERGRWKFHRNHCVHEHLLVPYAKGWGRSGTSRIPDAAKDAPPAHFARLRAQGGKQRPGPLTRSIRGWSVPTLEPGAGAGSASTTSMSRE
jgi:ketosteroid isomerase-like protein